MAHRPSSVALFLVLALSAGCGKKDEAAGDKKGGGKTDDKVASCDMPKFKSCREYRGGNLALGTDNLKKLCTASEGDFKDAACPTDKSIGACQVKEHKDIYYDGYLGGGPEALEKACKANDGTFTK